MSDTTRTPTLGAVALALALAFGTVPAVAQTAGSPQAAAIQQLNQLHAQLNLNAEQEPLWKDMLGATQREYQQAPANFKQWQQQMHTLLGQQILDLNQIHTISDQLQDENRGLHEATETSWLKLYDTLNAQQKTLVSASLKQHWKQTGAHH